MKRFLLLIFLFVATLNSNAQNWCPPGATWYTSVYSSVFAYDGLTEYKYAKDTLIQNKNCKKITGTFYGQNFTYYSTSTYTYVPDFRTYYTYEDNDVVYVITGTSFDTLVNFKAQIGEKWTMLHCPNESVFTYTVTDTSHMVINNMSLRKIKASYLYTISDTSGVYTFTLNDVFTERILGGRLDYEDLFGRGCFHKQHPGEAYGSLSFCGYSDNDFSTLPENGWAACRLTGIAENSASQIQVNMYPNPSAGRITVDIDQPVFVCVMNSLGSKVYEANFKDTGPHEINIEGVAAGIYYLEVRTAKGRGYQKIIKER